MINQNISVEKIVNGFIDMMRDDENKPRMSLLDLQIFLIINANKECGKNDLLEIINPGVISKSFLDRPVKRLTEYGLINMNHKEHVSTKDGEARTTYSISAAGDDFIKSCAKNGQ